MRSRTLNRWINVAWLMVAWIVCIQMGFGYLWARKGYLLATPAHIGGFVAGHRNAAPAALWRYRHA